jgi:hypothetical protein
MIAFLLTMLSLFVAAAPLAPPEHDPPARPITDPRAAERLAAAKAAAAKEDWPTAVRLLQTLLASPTDALVADPEERGRPVRRWVSARAAAGRLIANLPAKGRAAYRAAHGADADALLKRARATKNAELLARVVRVYLHTDAGPEALRSLATDHCHLARFDQAASCYALLLRELGLARWTAEELYQATVVFRRTGDMRNAAKTTKPLLARVAAGGLRLTGHNFTRAQLEAEWASHRPPPASPPAADWPLYCGDPARSDLGRGRAPILKPLWTQKTVFSKDTERELDLAQKVLAKGKLPALPAAVPVVLTVKRGRRPARQVLCYRSHWGVNTVDLRTGEMLWWYRSPCSMDGMFGVEVRGKPPDRNPDRAKELDDWLDVYAEPDRRPQVVLENSALGTLSSDRKYLFAVDDLAVPWPNLAPLTVRRRGGKVAFRFHRDTLRAIYNNRLQAFDLKRRGALTWELGGHNDDEGMTALPNSFFLGPPLPVGERLYAANQQGKTLRLITIESQTAKVLSIRALATTAATIPEDPVRRLQAVHLAYADGALIVPTNDGTVLCVDVHSGEPRWACTYRPSGLREVPPLPGLAKIPPPWVQLQSGLAVWSRIAQRGWQVTAPVLQGGKVVFTAPDADAVFCLNARDGKFEWSKPRSGDLYLAGVFAGKVLLVGNGRCRALRLADGKQLWDVATGTPSGQGVAVGGVYYLPLRSGSLSKEPEVCALNLNMGKVQARVPAKQVPGNLVFLDGVVVSQSVSTITAYPQVPAAARGGSKD